jgi:small-conductance mechanosensitive channel
MNTKGKSGRNIIDKRRGILVLMTNFGDSSVDLAIAFWMLVEDEPIWIAKAREAVYDSLNNNKIEIPFPQQDVYIHHYSDDKTDLSAIESKTK